MPDLKKMLTLEALSEALPSWLKRSTKPEYNADEIDSTLTTNQFVTASDKDNWNAKGTYSKPSGGIPKSDLSSIVQASLDKADSALQSETDPTVPSWAKQSSKPSYTQDEVADGSTYKRVTQTEKDAWSGKQNALSTTQMQAVNSGINSSKVGQISTNQTNILYVLDKTGKNILNPDCDSAASFWGMAITNNLDGSITLNGTVNHDTSYQYDAVYVLQTITPSAGKWCLSCSELDGMSSQCAISGDEMTSVNPIDTAETFNGNTSVEIRLRMAHGFSANNLTIKPMLCLLDDYKISNNYVPPSLPNYDLTYLQAEDRAALAEVVDSGAKSLIDLSKYTPAITTGLTLTTGNNNEYTVSGTVSATSSVEFRGIPKVDGTLIISGCPSGGSINGYSMDIFADGTAVAADLGSGSAPFTMGTSNTIRLRFAAGTYNNVKFKIMVCTKAAFGVSQKFVPFGNDPFYQVPINHNMIYRGRNLGATLTDAQHTALSSGNFTDLYLGDYWTKTVTIPTGTYTGGDGESVDVPAQTNITLKAVIADFDTFYAGYASSYAGINTHHAAVIVTGFSNVVWNKTNSTAGGYVASLIHKWLVGSALPQIETWFGSAKVLSHQKLLTNAITGDAASGWAWSSQKISLLSENQMYGSKVWGGSKAANGGYEPGEAFKHLNVFNHIDANLLFGNRNIWLRDIASAERAADLYIGGNASSHGASQTGVAPAALILLS